MSDEYTVLQFPITSGAIATNEIAIQEMITGLKRLIETGAIKGKLDDILKDYEVNLDARYTKAYLEPGVLHDASKLNTVGSAVSYNPSEEQRTFSVATILERLRLAKRDPKIRLRMIVQKKLLLDMDCC